MELTSIVSVIVGSIVLSGLVVSIAIDGIRRRSSGVNATTIPAVDSRWRKVKVNVSA